MARIHTSGTALVLEDGERIAHASARDAIDALRWVVAQDDVQAVFPCGWLVEAAPVWASDPDCDWFPDSPADMIRPCGSVAVGTARGWHCAHGHEHVSGADYFEEDEVHAMAQAGYLPGPDALLMDGRSVWAVR